MDPVFTKAAEMTAKNSGNDDFAMPTSLSGAGGAMKLSAADDAARATTNLENRKKKKCC